MLTKSIFELENYTAPITHYIGYITEYDIAKANINILLSRGLINPETYDYLYNADKKEREIAVGMMQRKDKELSRKLIEGFGIARNKFYTANNVKEYEVLSIKKDAIFIMNRTVAHTDFGPIHFASKNTYTSFYNLPGIEVYFYRNRDIENIDVKGISKENLKLHERYFLDLLQYIFATAQFGNSGESVSIVKDVSLSFANKEFDIEYYREFNARSMYRTKYCINGNTAFLDSVSANADKRYIDSIYNFTLLQELYKMYANDYFAFHK